MTLRKCLAAGLAPFLLLPFAGCGGVSLGSRAIVKAIYLDREQERVQAVLAVAVCEASADTASVEQAVHLYTGEGASIDEALDRACRAQSRRLFYGQNELLLLGPGTVSEDVTPFLDYFEQENAARPHMAVFLTTRSLEGLQHDADGLEEVIRQAGRIADGHTQEAGAYSTVYEAAPGPGKAAGWLPVLTWDEEGGLSPGVRSLLLLRDGRRDGLVRGTALQLALVLAGKAQRLAFTNTVDGQTVTLRTQPLQVQKTAAVTGEQVTVRLTGAVQALSVDGQSCGEEETRRMLPALNDHLQRLLEQLIACTFSRGNDAFGFAWWMRARDAGAVEKLLEAGQLYEDGRVQAQVQLFALQQ